MKLVDEVKEGGGEVRVLSSMHESGRRLEDLTGIAAILTYPIEDLDEEVGGGGNGADDDDEPNGRNDVHEDIDF